MNQPLKTTGFRGFLLFGVLKKVFFNLDVVPPQHISQMVYKFFGHIG
jgi:hypothetical protein